MRRVIVAILWLSACGDGPELDKPVTVAAAPAARAPSPVTRPALPAVEPVAETDTDETDVDDDEETGVNAADELAAADTQPVAHANAPAVIDDDRDSMDIVDEIDRCPDAPEDNEGFEDIDGCPDPDQGPR